MRLIDADRLREKRRMFHTDEYGDLVVTLDDIDAAPTVDPVKHAKWEFTHKDGPLKHMVSCSRCKTQDRFSLDVVGYFNYCPDCGAKMDSEDEHGNQ